MSQDLRELFKEEREKDFPMPAGHEARFEERLDISRRTGKSRSYLWMGLAASLIALLGLTLWLQNGSSTFTETPGEAVVEQASDTATTFRGISLGDLSPDLEKLENYYTASINMELANLDISDDNREVANEFILRLGELNTEYRQLSEELNRIGPNEQTIGAMIKNLQYRLQLMLKLKEKLIELKSSKNETVHSNSI
ncbi:MAG: hypothetical protein WBN56_05305 [Robiginitalea sp.]|uniref:hypothetical protein n=1 Tax=Robiginitalea sp. TaxID=1902411 RepID=UPI003C79104D